MKTLTRTTLFFALLLAPLSARAQERVAVPNVRSETDGVAAQLLTRALREAVLDAEDLRGSGPLGYDWTLRAEIHRASADEDDRLHVSLRLIPQDESRDERTVETTMSPNEPLAHFGERARSFLDALFGTALAFPELRDDAEEPVIAPAQAEAEPGDELDWQPIAAWTSVGVLAASLAVIVGAQVRLTNIENDPRWQDARDRYSVETEDICHANRLPSGGARSAYLADACAEASALEVAWSIAMGASAVSLVSAITFFVLDATGDEERPSVSVRASSQGVDVGVHGTF